MKFALSLLKIAHIAIIENIFLSGLNYIGTQEYSQLPQACLFDSQKSNNK